MLSAIGADADPAPVKKPGATVYLIDALPGGDITVGIDDNAATSVLSSKEVSDPMRLSAGRHVVTFSGSNPAWTVKAKVRLKSGASTDIVIHRPADATADPVVTTYNNDLKPIAGGKGRVAVAHTAVVPPADVLVDGQVVFSNIANGEFATADVPRSSLRVSLVPTNESAPVILGPLDLDVQGRTLTRVFAVGAPSNNSMDVIVQLLPLRATGSPPPTSVPLGSAGLVSDWQSLDGAVRSTGSSCRELAPRG